MTDVIRPTRQRQVVTEALNGLDQFRSAQDIHTLLTERGETVGLATVYRTLQLLAEAEIVDVVRSDAGESLYRQCSTGHHHHLVCRACGRTIEIEGPAVERWADAEAAKHGFSDVSHVLEVFGTCGNCR
jgi:Fur family ferric uptake transcriptional regulator